MSDGIRTNVAIAAQRRIPAQVVTSEGTMVGYVYLDRNNESQFGLTMFDSVPPVNVEMIGYANVVTVELLFAF